MPHYLLSCGLRRKGSAHGVLHHGHNLYAALCTGHPCLRPQQGHGHLYRSLLGDTLPACNGGLSVFGGYPPSGVSAYGRRRAYVGILFRSGEENGRRRSLRHCVRICGPLLQGDGFSFPAGSGQNNRRSHRHGGGDTCKRFSPAAAEGRKRRIFPEDAGHRAGPLFPDTRGGAFPPKLPL